MLFPTPNTHHCCPLPQSNNSITLSICAKIQMGCCFSKSPTPNPDDQNAFKNQQTHSIPIHPKSNLTHEVTPPPPPLLEEESVKEVLSETPITKPHQVPNFTAETNTHLHFVQNPDRNCETKDLNTISEPPQVQILTAETNTHLHFVRNPDRNFETKDPNPIIKPHKVPFLTPEPDTHLNIAQNPAGKFETKDPKPINKSEEISETCSISESISTTTTATITEKREEDEATSKRSCREGSTSTTTKIRKLNNGSPSRKRPNAVDSNVAGGRERRLKSPARRPEPSPDKKVHGVSRQVRGRESGPAANRRLNVGHSGVRRDSGEVSGRRSRSPSCVRADGAARKVGEVGGQKQVPAVKDAVEKGEEKGGSEKRGSEEVGEKNDAVSQEESIENPLVSMECFIFL